MGVFNSLVNVNSGVQFVSRGSSKVLGIAFCAISERCVLNLRIVAKKDSHRFGNHELLIHRAEVFRGKTEVFSDLTLHLNDGDRIIVESSEGQMSVTISASAHDNLEIIKDEDLHNSIVNKKTYKLDHNKITVHFDKVFFGTPSAMCTTKDRLFLTQSELLEAIEDKKFIKSLIYHIDQYKETFLSTVSKESLISKMRNGRSLATGDDNCLVFDWLQKQFYVTHVETKWCLPISFEEVV